MGHSNGKITAPINLAGDVYATLGIGSVNGAYDLGYACANTHGKINPWARYKPVRYESLAPGANEKWWQGWDGNCGVKPFQMAGYWDAPIHARRSVDGTMILLHEDFVAPVLGDEEISSYLYDSNELSEILNSEVWTEMN